MTYLPPDSLSQEWSSSAFAYTTEVQAASLYRALTKYSGEMVGECGGTMEGADGARDGLAVTAVGNAMGEVEGIAEGANDGKEVIVLATV